VFFPERTRGKQDLDAAIRDAPDHRKEKILSASRTRAIMDGAELLVEASKRLY
jgi:hypothetical protein